MLYLGMGTEVVVFFISAFDRPFDKTAIGLDLPTSLSPAKEDEEETAETDEEQLSAEPIVVQPASSGQPAANLGGGTIIIGGGVAAPGAVPAAGTVAAAGASENTPELLTAQTNYVDALNSLTETLGKVSEQSRRLSVDSEEMENLNRTLTGICKVYEMQLKSASQQIGTIDQINEQTRRMAEQIEQLNQIYARMITAMTANLKD